MTYYKLKDLPEDFNLNQKHLQTYPSQSHTKRYYQSDNNLIRLLNLIEERTITFDSSLLKFIICYKFKNLIQDKNILLRFTNRSKIIQQRDLNEFEKLLDSSKEVYYQFADKVLAWIQTKFFSENLTKIVIDRIANCNNPDIRITLYEGNQVDDLYLIIEEQINNLKEIKLNQPKNEIKSHNHLLAQLKDILDNSKNVLSDIAQLLNQTKDEQHIRQIFKLIIGVESSYRIITSPELMIIGFDKLALPSSLDISYHNNILELNFDNDCSFICQIEQENNDKTLIINLADLPKDLELISL